MLLLQCAGCGEEEERKKKKERREEWVGQGLCEKRKKKKERRKEREKKERDGLGLVGFGLENGCGFGFGSEFCFRFGSEFFGENHQYSLSKNGVSTARYSVLL